MSKAATTDKTAASGSADATNGSANTADGELELFEYETQYFGFTPVSFTDGVTNAINDAVFEAIDELLVVQLKRGVPKDVAVGDLKNVLAKLQSAIDRNFDLFELYALANIFHIPEGVWIPTDKTAENTYGRTEEQNIDDEVQRLKSAIKTEKMRQAVLEVEVIKLEEAKVSLTELTQKIDALTKLCVENDVQNIGEHVAFVCESANELQKEVGNLMAARRAGLRPRAKKQAGVRPQHPVQALSSKDVQAVIEWRYSCVRKTFTSALLRRYSTHMEFIWIGANTCIHQETLWPTCWGEYDTEANSRKYNTLRPGRYTV